MCSSTFSSRTSASGCQRVAEQEGECSRLDLAFRNDDAGHPAFARLALAVLPGLELGASWQRFQHVPAWPVLPDADMRLQAARERPPGRGRSRPWPGLRLVLSSSGANHRVAPGATLTLDEFSAVVRPFGFGHLAAARGGDGALDSVSVEVMHDQASGSQEDWGGNIWSAHGCRFGCPLSTVRPPAIQRDARAMREQVVKPVLSPWTDRTRASRRRKRPSLHPR